MNGTYGLIRKYRKQRPVILLYARTYNAEVKQALAQGKNVLLVPEQLKGRKTKFASHFWNSIMLNWDPMIVGTLIDSDHPAFSNFPTDSYADWQWWDILNYAAAMELDQVSQCNAGYTDC